MLIDSHAHISSDAFEPSEWGELIERARQSGVEYIINICSDLNALENGIKLKKQYSNVYLAAACPPHDVSSTGEAFYDAYKKVADQGFLVAVGETGLDYYYEHSDKPTQKKYLEIYLSEAIDRDLPCVIHCREAFKDFFGILDDLEAKRQKKVRGVLHCFTGTSEEAQELVRRGWFISYSGIATFKKSTDLRETLKYVPVEHILVETDSPYLAPPPHRGKRNEPSFLPKVVEVIADHKRVSVEELTKKTAENTRNLFKLP